MNNVEPIPTPVGSESTNAGIEEERIQHNILGVQHALIRSMVPREIKNDFQETDGEQLDSFADFLSFKWIQQYSKLFRVYVDQIRSSQVEDNEEMVEFRNRLITGLLTPDDYVTIRAYLEAPENQTMDGDEKMGGLFLASEKEIADFKEEYKMSLN